MSSLRIISTWPRGSCAVPWAQAEVLTSSGGKECYRYSWVLLMGVCCSSISTGGLDFTCYLRHREKLEKWRSVSDFYGLMITICCPWVGFFIAQESPIWQYLAPRTLLSALHPSHLGAASRRGWVTRPSCRVFLFTSQPQPAEKFKYLSTLLNGGLGVECSNHSVPTIFFNDLAQSEKVGLFHVWKIPPHLPPRKNRTVCLDAWGAPVRVSFPAPNIALQSSTEFCKWLKSGPSGPFFGAPSMGAILWVKVPP